MRGLLSGGRFWFSTGARCQQLNKDRGLSEPENSNMDVKLAEHKNLAASLESARFFFTRNRN